MEFFQILEKREILTVREFERVDFFFLKSNLIDIIAAKERGLGSDVWHVSSHIGAYLPGKGEPQINKCGPWWGAGHCTRLLWTTMTSSSMRARQLHHFSSRVSAFERGPFFPKNWYFLKKWSRTCKNVCLVSSTNRVPPCVHLCAWGNISAREIHSMPDDC